MQDLRLSGVHNVTDTAFSSLAGLSSGGGLTLGGGGGAFSPSLQLLQSLTLAHLPALTDDAIASVAAACPDLRALDVSGCTGLTERGFDALARRCVLLRELRAGGCSEAVSIAGVLRLAKRCRLLRVLEVGRALFSPSAASTASAAVASAAGVADSDLELQLPPGQDASFRGDVFELLLSLALCCPFLEQVSRL